MLDEPTTGLDVTTQEQILDLLRRLRGRVGMAMLYVTHDLGVLGEIADRVGVMYAGHMVEMRADRRALRASRAIPTRAGSSRRCRGSPAKRPQRRLRGMLRRQRAAAGCPFAPRCDHAERVVRRSRQQLDVGVAPGHLVACQRWKDRRHAGSGRRSRPRTRRSRGGKRRGAAS